MAMCRSLTSVYEPFMNQKKKKDLFGLSFSRKIPHIETVAPMRYEPATKYSYDHCTGIFP